MTILALDLGTNYGYTFNGINGYTRPLPKTDRKFIDFYSDLREFYSTERLTEIVYEAAAFQPGAAIPIYHGLVGILKCFAAEYGLKITGIAVGTIKKSFTGDGRADKKKVMDKCDELGYTYIDNNSTDAIAVWHTYKKLYGN